MTKSKRKLIVVGLIIICLASIIGFAIAQRSNSSNSNCQDIIGDGYAMGTDPEPVVIGNTCDL